MPHNDEQDRSKREPGSGKQTDLAEGELETVEESIRIHEKKGDLQNTEESNRRSEEDKNS
jgi:hypothetical protein